MAERSEAAFEAARASGLVVAAEPLLVLLSGGVDSVCLLDVAVRLRADVAALHVNYGLRPGADADEAFCRELCGRLAVQLFAERATLDAASGPGNVQAEARGARYALAERIVAERGGDYAAAHTASDQAETVLYRLGVSPGSRALLGMAPRRGRLVRPLLRATKEDTRAYCEARGLEWREDPSNLDPRFARSRLRHEVMPVLRALNPRVDQIISDTSTLLRDEREVLEALALETLERIGAPPGGASAPLDELRRQPRGLARAILTLLAERAAGRVVALSRDDSDAVLDLGAEGGTQMLDLGGGLRAVAEYGVLRFTAEAEEAKPPEAVTLAVPGRASFGDWEVEARVVPPVVAAGGGYLPSRGDAVVSRAELGDTVVVRSWRDGDRIRPVGLDGSKTLQDLFTDRKVPRGLRRSLPVVEAQGEVAWVAGVAVGERFRPKGDEELVALSARRRAEAPPPDAA